MTIFYNYVLKDPERYIAFKVGEERSKNCRKMGIKQNKHSFRSSLFIDQNGAAGEIALIGMLLELDIICKEKYTFELDRICKSELKSANLGLDDGDVEVLNYNIDVKTSEYENAHLWLTDAKKNAIKVDYYCLFTGNINLSNIFKYRGCLSRKFIEENWDNHFTQQKGKYHQTQLKYFPWNE